MSTLGAQMLGMVPRGPGQAHCPDTGGDGLAQQPDASVMGMSCLELVRMFTSQSLGAVAVLAAHMPW